MPSWHNPSEPQHPWQLLPQGIPQAPSPQLSPEEVQSRQEERGSPHASSAVPGWQAPLAPQQPAAQVSAVQGDTQLPAEQALAPQS